MFKTCTNRKSGNAMAEMPGSIFILIIGLMLPMLGFLTLSYRAILLYNGARNACYQAAIEPSYTEAKTKAQTTLLEDTEKIAGLTLAAAQPKVQIVVKRLSNGVETVFNNKLAAGSVNTLLNSYFIRTTVTASITPLVQFPAGGFWTGIPGLTGPIQINGMYYQVYAENPSGLES